MLTNTTCCRGRCSLTVSRALPSLVLLSACAVGGPSGGRSAYTVAHDPAVQAAAHDPRAAVQAGDACLARTDLNCAILTYYAVVVSGVPGPWVPHALYQQGRAFSMAGDPADARLAWSKLLRDYPLSPEAEPARRALDALDDGEPV